MFANLRRYVIEEFCPFMLRIFVKIPEDIDNESLSYSDEESDSDDDLVITLQ